MRVRNAITESQANGYTVAAIAREHGLSELQVLQYLDSAARGYNTPRDEVEALSQTQQFIRERKQASRIDSKAPTPPGKVIPHVRRKDRLGAHTGTLEEPLVYSIEAGFTVARLCTICNLPIQPTGKRGRPRTIHKECRT